MYPHIIICPCLSLSLSVTLSVTLSLSRLSGTMALINKISVFRSCTQMRTTLQWVEAAKQTDRQTDRQTGDPETVAEAAPALIRCRCFVSRAAASRQLIPRSGEPVLLARATQYNPPLPLLLQTG